MWICADIHTSWPSFLLASMWLFYWRPRTGMGNIWSSISWWTQFPTVSCHWLGLVRVADTLRQVFHIFLIPVLWTQDKTKQIYPPPIWPDFHHTFIPERWRADVTKSHFSKHTIKRSPSQFMNASLWVIDCKRKRWPACVNALSQMDHLTRDRMFTLPDTMWR